MQIIASCFFATVEKVACAKDDGEDDDSFVYEIETASFELPKVRFDFSVSPPPPPPFNLEVYQEIVSMDPHGFQMVRARLEDVFPRLSDVATSSAGASVGSVIADFDMPAAKLTKAYLATHGMTPDGLGARVIQSKHTGRWRPGPSSHPARSLKMKTSDALSFVCSQPAKNCGTSSTTERKRRRVAELARTLTTHTTPTAPTTLSTTATCFCTPCWR